MFFLSFLNAENTTEFQIWKLFRIDEKAILITDNLDVWELNYLNPNKRTWVEWFYQTPTEELFGNEYLYTDKLWNNESLVICSDYPWFDSFESKIYRNDNCHLSLCTHIVENIDTKEKAFARKICTEDWKKIYDSFISRYILEWFTLGDIKKAEEMKDQEIKLFTFIFKKFCKELSDKERVTHESSSGFLADDEYAKYVDFENSFSFISTILSINEKRSSEEYFQYCTYMNYFNKHFLHKYQALQNKAL